MGVRQTLQQNRRRVFSFNPTPLLEVGAIRYCLIQCQQPEYDFERKYISIFSKTGATSAAFREAPDFARRVKLNQYGRRRET